MRVVIAPDKFKGSLSAPEVASRLSTGLRAGFAASRPGEGFETTLIPVADGGEGTLDAAVGSGFTRRSATVTGPTGPADHGRIRRPRHGSRHRNGGGLRARGASRLRRRQRAKLRNRQELHKPGHRRLIRAALDLGCRHIILGVGGSANTDGGAGVLQGLGAVLLDADGNELPGGGAALARWTGSTSRTSTSVWRSPSLSWRPTSTIPFWAAPAPPRSSDRRRARRRTTSPRSTRHWSTSCRCSPARPVRSPGRRKRSGRRRGRRRRLHRHRGVGRGTQAGHRRRARIH